MLKNWRFFREEPQEWLKDWKTCLTVEPISSYQIASYEKLKTDSQVSYIRKRNSETEAPLGNSIIRISRQKWDEFILYMSSAFNSGNHFWSTSQDYDLFCHWQVEIGCFFHQLRSGSCRHRFRAALLLTSFQKLNLADHGSPLWLC